MDPVKPAGIPLCRYLRAKNSFGMMEGGENLWYQIDESNATYWCIKTGNPIGPDNQLAAPAQCLQERKCFEKDT
jgi:hypothetical protein